MKLGTAETQRDVRRRGSPTTASPGSASAPASRTTTCPRRWSRRPSERGFPLFEIPYEVPFIAVTEKAFTRLVNEQYAVLQRSIAAQERLAADRAQRARAGRRRRRARRAGRRHGARLRRPRRAAGAAHASAARSRRGRSRRARRASCASAPARGEAARLRARRRASLAAARSRCRSCARRRDGTGDGGAAAGLARRRQGRAAALAEFDRLMLHQAVTVVALELLRRRVADDDRAPARRRRAVGGVSRRADGPRARAPARAVRARRARRRARPAPRRARAAEALSRRRWRDGAARRGGRRRWSPARPLRRARCCPALARRGAVRAGASASARASRRRSALALARRRRAAPSRRARARRFHEARCALEAREMSGRRRPGRRTARRARASPPLLATYRDLGSFQLLLSLQDTDALRLFCDSLLGPIEDGEGALRRRADALARGVHRVQRAVGGGGAAALLPPPHAALPDPQDRGAHRPRLASARDRIEFWLALRGREIGRRSREEHPYDARLRREGRRPHRDQDRRVPRRADARRACASSSDHGHEVSSRRAPARARRSPTPTTSRRARRIVPDADAVFAEAEMIVKVKEPQPAEVARLEPRHTLFTYLHLAPDPELTQGLIDSGATCIAYETVEDARGPAAAAGADERGRGQDRHAGRRVHAREAARRPRDPARRRARRRGGQGHGHRRRRGRHERRVHRDRHGGRGLRLRPQHRPPARARRRCFAGRARPCFASTLEIEQRLPERPTSSSAPCSSTAPRRRTSSRASSSG